MRAHGTFAGKNQNAGAIGLYKSFCVACALVFNQLFKFLMSKLILFVAITFHPFGLPSPGASCRRPLYPLDARARRDGATQLRVGKRWHRAASVGAG